MKLSGVIFDMDGTLLDSMAIWENLGSDYLFGKGLVPQPDLRRALFPLTLQEAASYLKERYALSETPEEMVEEFNSIVENFYCHVVPAKQGVKSLLETWHSRGIKMYVATATGRRLSQAALERTGLLPCLEGLISCEEIGCGKERPDVYLEALRRLGTKKEETLVAEDALHAIQTAKAAGFPVAAVYDAFSADCWEEIKTLSDYCFKTWEEAKGVFL